MLPVPSFRYHPDPFKTRTFVPSLGVCPVCDMMRGFAYEGPFYAADDVEGICPWCIASGAAAQKYDGAFLDAAMLDAWVLPEAREELAERTPSYTSWQTEVWPTHCGDFCAFINYVGWTEIKPYLEELTPDLERFQHVLQLTLPQLSEFLFKDGDMSGYLFQCLTCRTHRLHIDFN